MIEPKWSPDGGKHIVARWNNKARIFNVGEIIELQQEFTHKTKESGIFPNESVWDIAFSPNGNYLAIGFGKKEIQIWNYSTKRRLKIVKGSAFSSKDNCCIATAFSPDSSYFAVRSDDSCLIYNTADQSLFTKFNLEKRLISVNFSPC